MAFQSITTGTYTIFPTANDIASTTNDGKLGKETTFVSLFDAMNDGKDWIISGFDYASASGLTATFNGGFALIKGYWFRRVGTFEATLTASQTNHVWLTYTVDGDNNIDAWGLEVNITGTPPASTNYVKLAELTTDGSTVTSDVDSRDLTAGNVPSSLYDANTILAATLDNTPAALTVAEQTVVGRITGGSITALTATQLRTLINVEDGADVTDATNVAAAGAIMASGGTMSGTLSLADNIISRPVLEDYAIQGSAVGNVGATRTFDCSVANYFTATVDQVSTFTFSNPPATGDAGGFRLVLTNGGAFAITFPASVDWDGGTAPTLTASGIDILDFTTSDAGTIWYGTVVGLDMK